MASSSSSSYPSTPPPLAAPSPPPRRSSHSGRTSCTSNTTTTTIDSPPRWREIERVASSPPSSRGASSASSSRSSSSSSSVLFDEEKRTLLDPDPLATSPTRSSASPLRTRREDWYRRVDSFGDRDPQQQQSTKRGRTKTKKTTWVHFALSLTFVGCVVVLASRWNSVTLRDASAGRDRFADRARDDLVGFGRPRFEKGMRRPFGEGYDAVGPGQGGGGRGGRGREGSDDARDRHRYPPARPQDPGPIVPLPSITTLPPRRRPDDVGAGTDGAKGSRLEGGADQEAGRKMVKVPKKGKGDTVTGAGGATPDDDATDRDDGRAFDPDERFLVVGWMGEQETKAQAHLYQLSLLATALNRTLVLPGVRKSRFGTCYLENDFSLYYDDATFDRFGVRAVTARTFEAWVEEKDRRSSLERNKDGDDVDDEEDVESSERQRGRPPGVGATRSTHATARMISFARGDPVPLSALDATPRHFCLEDWALDWTRHDPEAFFIPTSDWKDESVRERFADAVVGTLLNGEGYIDHANGQATIKDQDEPPSVLVVQYNLRFPFLSPESIARLSPYEFDLPRPYSYFPYSNHWVTLGETIADRLTPFVGIHWRTETLEVDRIERCGARLVEQVQEIRTLHPDVSTLYLATDYPIELARDSYSDDDGTNDAKGPIVANSGTMTKTLTPAHHEAFRTFLASLEREASGRGDGTDGRATGKPLRVVTFKEAQRMVDLPPSLRNLLPSTPSEDGRRGRTGRRIGTSRSDAVDVDARSSSSFVGGFESLDPAIAGLVDKIVLSSASLFFRGVSLSDDKVLGCAKHSQFTTQIESRRRDALELGKQEEGFVEHDGYRGSGSSREGGGRGRLWNEAGTFGLREERG
ncbi:hypothetical protein JCM10212_005326 [Sporobolomyces blumeae]